MVKESGNINFFIMYNNNFIIKSWGELNYNAPSSNNQVECILTRKVILKSNDVNSYFQDDIVATLWDGMALEALAEGDEVKVTLLFSVLRKNDGTDYLKADVVNIKKVNKYGVIPW